MEIKRDKDYMSYIFEENKFFFDIGYKVLQNDNNAFIQCLKVKQNGKIKLVYNIGKYRECEDFILSENKEKIIKLIINILKTSSNIETNGFIEYKCISTNLNDIFVDENSLDVRFIYIPYDSDVFMQEKEFVERIKKNIITHISKNPICRTVAIDIIGILNADFTNKDIISKLQKLSLVKDPISGNKYVNGFSEGNLSNAQKIENVNKVQNYQSENKERKSKFSLMGRLFNKEKNGICNNNSNLKKTTMGQEPIQSYANIDRNFKYSLLGINNIEHISFDINKREYTLGTKQGLVDGYMSFNKAISRKHCKIEILGNDCFLTDLGSSNGTYLNGKKLEVGIKKELKENDYIKIANSEFVFKRR